MLGVRQTSLTLRMETEDQDSTTTVAGCFASYSRLATAGWPRRYATFYVWALDEQDAQSRFRESDGREAGCTPLRSLCLNARLHKSSLMIAWDGRAAGQPNSAVAKARSPALKSTPSLQMARGRQPRNRPRASKSGSRNVPAVCPAVTSFASGQPLADRA